MMAAVLFAVAAAINLSVSRADLQRAAALAAWPHTDAERVRFHDGYLFLTAERHDTRAVGPRVLQIEIVTEFRRMELIAEEHARLGDSFGHGGSDELLQAIRPWRGRLAVDVHLQLPPCGEACAPVIPPIDVAIDGVDVEHAHPAVRSVMYARSGLSPALLGSMAEATLDARAIGNASRVVRVIVEGREVARAAIDFSTIE